jgi:flagellar motility protein MotE (MotC chaperone)
MSLVKTSLLVLGGTGLFAGSFVGIAMISGHSMHEIPLLGKFSKAPVQPIVTPPQPIEPIVSHEPEHVTETPQEVPVKRPVTASVLGAFLLPAPFNSDELADMQQRLAARVAEAEKTLADAKAKERALDERERALLGREAELQALKTDLDTRTKELVGREEELKRDSDAALAQEQASWNEVARFFQEGEPDELGKKLATFEPVNAARILHQLDDERAIAIVNSLPPDKYKQFLDAYRKTAKSKSP